MLAIITLATALSAINTGTAPTKGPAHDIHACLEAMDGPVYQGDPADRKLARENVETCDRAAAIITKIPQADKHPLTVSIYKARLLETGATIAYMSLHDPVYAYKNIKTARHLFQEAAQQVPKSSDEHYAFVAQYNNTTLQLKTLANEPKVIAYLKR